MHKTNAPTFRFAAQLSYAFTELQSLSEKELQVELWDGAEVIGQCAVDLLSLATGAAEMQQLSLVDVRTPCSTHRHRRAAVVQMLMQTFVSHARPHSHTPHRRREARASAAASRSWRR